jgi:hypothetical protein
MRAAPPWTLPVIGALALLPCVAVVVCIHRYAGFLPLGDQWYTPGGLIEAQLEGRLYWKQFFFQHNEARKAFTSAVWMALAANGWRPRLEMYTTALLVGVCVLLYHQICQRAAPRARIGPALLLAVASVLLFNPVGLAGGQPPWLWGINLENAVVIVALLGATCANVRLGSWPLRYGISAACSLAATYSFANGMLLWVLLHPRWLGPWKGALAPTRRMLWLDVAYVAAFVTVVVTYFRGYVRPAGHAALSDALASPGLIVEFFFAWLGAPLSPRIGSMAYSTAIGGAGVALFLWSVVQVVRQGAWARALPFVVIAIYTLISAAAVSLGRASMGGATAPRYFLHVVPFYLGLAGLLWLSTSAAREARQWPAAGVAAWSLLGLQVISVASNWVGIQREHAQIYHRRIAHCEAALCFVELVPDNPDLALRHLSVRDVVGCFTRLARDGVLAVELGPRRSELVISSAVIDQSAALFILTENERPTVRGAVVDGNGVELSHLLLCTRFGAQEKFVSVLPLAAYPRESRNGPRQVDVAIATDNFPTGLLELELFGYDETTRRCVTLGVATELRRGPITVAEIRDATSLSLRPDASVVTLDTVNGQSCHDQAELSIPRGEALEVRGWAIDRARGELAARVHLKLGQRMFPAECRQTRLDVAERLERPDLAACGFRCVVEAALLGAEDGGPLSIVVETRHGELLEHPHRLLIRRVDR